MTSPYLLRPTRTYSQVALERLRTKLAEARRLSDRARRLECDGSMFVNPLKVEAWRAINRRVDALYDEIDAMGITDAQIRLWDEE